MNDNFFDVIRGFIPFIFIIIAIFSFLNRMRSGGTEGQPQNKMPDFGGGNNSGQRPGTSTQSRPQQPRPQTQQHRRSEPEAEVSHEHPSIRRPNAASPNYSSQMPITQTRERLQAARQANEAAQERYRSPLMRGRSQDGLDSSIASSGIARGRRGLSLSASELRQAVILAEVIGPPRAKKKSIR